MTDQAHSPLGASGAYRWFVCPASPRQLGSRAGDEPSESPFAKEGTVAHELATHCVRRREWDATLYVGCRLGDFTLDCGKSDPNSVISQEMAEAVNVFLADVRDTMQPDDMLFVEVRFVLDHLTDHNGHHPHGRADVVLYRAATGELFVFDYKHGVGLLVAIDDNKQLRYYGLGAALHLMKNEGARINKVHLRVVQPRSWQNDAEPVRRETIDFLDLYDWESELIEAVERTKAPDAPHVPGKHCRFCDPMCPAFYQAAKEVACNTLGEVVEPSRLDLALMGRMMNNMHVLKAWIRAFEEFTDKLAKEKGLVPKGYKLVPTQARRQWGLPAETIVRQLERAFPGVSFMSEPELVSPAQAEKRIKGLPGAEVLETLVERKSGGTKLVPLGDPRPDAKLLTGEGFTALEE